MFSRQFTYASLGNGESCLANNQLPFFVIRVFIPNGWVMDMVLVWIVQLLNNNLIKEYIRSKLLYLLYSSCAH